MKKGISLLLCTLCITFGISAQHEEKPKHLEKSKKNEITQTLKEDTTDPVCKMSVSKGSKQVSVYKGKQVGFCSIVCKEMFDKNPKKYASHHH